MTDDGSRRPPHERTRKLSVNTLSLPVVLCRRMTEDLLHISLSLWFLILYIVLSIDSADLISNFTSFIAT